MGIKGLLPALASIKRQRHIREYSGGKAAIDGFAWLHRAAFTSVQEVVFGGNVDRPVDFCLKRAAMLRRHDVEPIFVFDGASLPSKAATNASRRQARVEAKAQAQQLMEEGKKTEARKLLGQAISIKHELVSALIRASRGAGIECIVAPYEADAELGYLSHIDYVQVVISEDSDLLLYGCKEVLFKLDDVGNGIAIAAADLPNAGIFPPERFTGDALVVLCCLAGCDYVDSAKGIGIKKGAKYVNSVFGGLKEETWKQELVPNVKSELTGTAADDKENVKEPTTPSNRLRILTHELRAVGYDISETYHEDLKRALYTFKYQTVFDPSTKSLTRRYPLPVNVSEQLADFIGPMFDDDIAVEVCRGDIDPHTHEPTGLQTVPIVSQGQKKPSKPLNWLDQLGAVKKTQGPRATQTIRKFNFKKGRSYTSQENTTSTSTLACPAPPNSSSPISRRNRKRPRTTRSPVRIVTPPTAPKSDADNDRSFDHRSPPNIVTGTDMKNTSSQVRRSTNMVDRLSNIQNFTASSQQRPSRKRKRSRSSSSSPRVTSHRQAHGDDTPQSDSSLVELCSTLPSSVPETTTAAGGLQSMMFKHLDTFRSSLA